ncbi:transposase domain-containing protein [Rhodococcus koreensis]|nr:transposase domain-containing protein [Rhodococcus koreensis]
MADDDSGEERGGDDRLTDRIGLGVLTRIVHRDLVDEVLTETGAVERRRRCSPPESWSISCRR